MADASLVRAPIDAQVAFWASVPQNVPRDKCWPWGGNLNANGYGRIAFGGKKWIASRLMAEVKVGRGLAHEEFACHTCDNPRCVNPDHLFVGTAADNTRDMWVKGRSGLNSALTEEEVLHVWSLRNRSHGAVTRVAKQLGLHRLVVHRIWTGESYPHITRN